MSRAVQAFTSGASTGDTLGVIDAARDLEIKSNELADELESLGVPPDGDPTLVSDFATQLHDLADAAAATYPECGAGFDACASALSTNLLGPFRSIQDPMSAFVDGTE